MMFVTESQYIFRCVFKRFESLFLQLRSIVLSLPVTGEFNGFGLGRPVHPDQHLVQEPATAAAAPVVAHPHPPYLAQRHRLDQELIVLQ